MTRYVFLRRFLAINDTTPIELTLNSWLFGDAVAQSFVLLQTVKPVEDRARLSSDGDDTEAGPRSGLDHEKLLADWTAVVGEP